MYTRTLPAFGALPVVRTEAERNAVIADNAKKTADYQIALAQWRLKRDAFLKATADYNGAVARAEAEYQASLARYNQAVLATQAESAGRAAGYASALAAYGAQKRARDAQIESNRQAAMRVLGTNPMPPGFAANGYCATQAQHDQWAWACAPVRGLGGNDPVCVWQNLTVCSVGPAPVPPRQPGPVTRPIAPVRAAPPPRPLDPGAEPKPPVLQVVPSVAVPPPPKPRDPIPQRPPPPIPELPPPRPPEEPEAAPRQGMAVFGILALVVVAGGGAYWYTHRKKKQAA